jgi:hypothetical protein
MVARSHESEPLVAYVYGDNPPDFGALAAMGFDAVCLDSNAGWFRESMIAEAEREGLLAVAHPMSFVAREQAPVTARR